MGADAFEVSLSRHLLTGAVLGNRRVQRRLADLESAWLRDRLDEVRIQRPVWISGLARAGSTVLLEVLASLPGVATHQYRDFPFVHTPYWWRTYVRKSTRDTYDPVERAHGDRLKVTPASPEAMEEVFWPTFFEGLHDPTTSNVLDRTTRNPAFEAFFRDHIRKLLLVEDAERYVAKANYDLTRLPYLLSLFPDASFVVPVRHPLRHVASLMKQHDLFVRAAAEHPRSVAHLDRVGHFEFGAHRTPINAGDEGAVASILEDWAAGREVKGWARYWAHLHGWLRDRLVEDEALRSATLVVRYEELCAETGPVLRKILRHTGLERDAGPTVERYLDAISEPTYYEPDFTPRERRTIARETAAVAASWGYDLPSSPIEP